MADQFKVGRFVSRPGARLFDGEGSPISVKVNQERTIRPSCTHTQGDIIEISTFSDGHIALLV